MFSLGRTTERADITRIIGTTHLQLLIFLKDGSREFRQHISGPGESSWVEDVLDKTVTRTPMCSLELRVLPTPLQDWKPCALRLHCIL